VLTLLQRRTRWPAQLGQPRRSSKAVTWSVHRQGAALALVGRDWPLANPIAADLSDMRRACLPACCGRRSANVDRGQVDVALFEVGPNFLGDGETEQRIAASAVRRGIGQAAGPGRHCRPGTKASTSTTPSGREALLATLGVPLAGLTSCRRARLVPPGRSGSCSLGHAKLAGYFGEFHPRTLEALDHVKGPLCGFRDHSRYYPAAQGETDTRQDQARAHRSACLERISAFFVDRAGRQRDLEGVQGADRVIDRRRLESSMSMKVPDRPRQKSVASP